MKTLFVLSTIILNRKNYVATQMSNRSGDNKKIVNYTPNPAQARDFGSIADAEAFIDRIVNPHERLYVAESVEVSEEQLRAVVAVEEEEIR